MLRWIRRKLVEIVAEAFHTTRESNDSPLQDQLDDYADHQIAWLLFATREYQKAKKDPDAFVERYFSAKIKPIVPFVDSWAQDLVTGKTLRFGWAPEPKDEEEE